MAQLTPQTSENTTVFVFTTTSPENSAIFLEAVAELIRASEIYALIPKVANQTDQINDIENDLSSLMILVNLIQSLTTADSSSVGMGQPARSGGGDNFTA